MTNLLNDSLKIVFKIEKIFEDYYPLIGILNMLNEIAISPQQSVKRLKQYSNMIRISLASIYVKLNPVHPNKTIRQITSKNISKFS